MNKNIISVVVATLVASSSFAQLHTPQQNLNTRPVGQELLLAGFEFYSASPGPTRGFYIGTYNSNTANGTILDAADNINAFRSDVLANADAKIVFGGRFGATLDWASGTEGGNLSEVYAATGTATVNRSVTRAGLTTYNMSNVTDRGAMAISTVYGDPNGDRFAIVFDTFFAGASTNPLYDFGAEDVTLSFAGAIAGADNSATVTWYVSGDEGVTAIPTGISTVVTGGYLAYSVDLSAFSAIEGIENAVILAEISGLSSRSEFRFDNVQVKGKLTQIQVPIIPEPSTIAAIAAGLLGLVIVRRRR